MEDFTAWLRFNGFTCHMDGWLNGPVRVYFQGTNVALYAYDRAATDPTAHLTWTAAYAGAPLRVVGHAIEQALTSAVAALLPD